MCVFPNQPKIIMIIQYLPGSYLKQSKLSEHHSNPNQRLLNQPNYVPWGIDLAA